MIVKTHPILFSTPIVDIDHTAIHAHLMDFMDFLIDDPAAFMLAKNGGSVSKELHVQEVQWENFKRNQVAKYFLYKTFGSPE